MKNSEIFLGNGGLPFMLQQTYEPRARGMFPNLSSLIHLIRWFAKRKNYDACLAIYYYALDTNLVDAKTFGCVMVILSSLIKKASKEKNWNAVLQVYWYAATVYCDAAARDLLGGPEIWTKKIFWKEIVACYNRAMTKTGGQSLREPTDAELQAISAQLDTDLEPIGLQSKSYPAPREGEELFPSNNPFLHESEEAAMLFEDSPVPETEKQEVLPSRRPVAVLSKDHPFGWIDRPK